MEISKLLEERVVRFENNGNTFGSGFIVKYSSSKGFISTCFHVADNITTHTSISTDTYSNIEILKIHFDEDSDICIIEFFSPEISETILELETKLPQVNYDRDSIWCVGYPRFDTGQRRYSIAVKITPDKDLSILENYNYNDKINDLKGVSGGPIIQEIRDQHYYLGATESLADKENVSNRIDFIRAQKIQFFSEANSLDIFQQDAIPAEKLAFLFNETYTNHAIGEMLLSDLLHDTDKLSKHKLEEYVQLLNIDTDDICDNCYLEWFKILILIFNRYRETIPDTELPLYCNTRLSELITTLQENKIELLICDDQNLLSIISDMYTHPTMLIKACRSKKMLVSTRSAQRLDYPIIYGLQAQKIIPNISMPVKMTLSKLNIDSSQLQFESDLIETDHILVDLITKDSKVQEAMFTADLDLFFKRVKEIIESVLV